ncbi:transcriptional regulator [Paenibacillus kribbensis]|uniref:Transcriptional regulator n=1 Tax=Paenibacillus kribbensis TaxID=172713 RepID=A0A222WQX1_9BACL|nr:helix-turn-helix transcriptional regulator [Paenibacillus kribbensis]ASR48385.1 transcriptional regulator [Paenibacillus kribbensis]
MLKFRIKLKEVLKDRGITQKKLEELSGVPQSKISNLCNNKFQELNINNIEKIAYALHIKDISILMGFEEE